MKTPVNWQIKNLDTGEVFLPPYPVSEEGVRISGIGGVYVEEGRFGMDPVVNWVASKSKTYAFQTVLFAETTADNIEAKFIALKRLAEKDDILGRPPICLFTYGNADVMVLVETVDPQIRPVRDDGSPRLIVLDIGLRKYKPFSQTQIDPTKPGKESYYLVASAAEASYEAIAKRFYGSPMAGDRLRKRHPDMPLQPTVGTQVKVPAKSIILREVVTPSFHAFSPDDADAADAFQDLLDRRAEHKVVV